MEKHNYVLGDGKGFVDLVSSLGTDSSVVNAARVSFGKRISKIEEKDVKLISYLLKEKHSSPFEHVAFTFHVKCPLFVARQWMRHRTQSYNEISRRYTSENLDFYIPNQFRYQNKIDRQASDLEKSFSDEENVYLSQLFLTMSEESVIVYNELLEKGVAREMARMILPQNMYTEFYTTVNLWNLFHFINLRTSDHAQQEIKVYAEKMLDLIKYTVPYSVEAWKGL